MSASAAGAAAAGAAAAVGEGETSMNKSERQIYNCLDETSSKTAAELSEELGKSERELVEIINGMLNKGLIQLSGTQGGNPAFKLLPEDQKWKIGLDQNDRCICDKIEAAGGKGIWTANLRRQTGMEKKLFNQCLKKLERRNIIKAVQSVTASKRKMYMLFNQVPDDSVTGGAWYSGQEFDAQFTSTVRKVVKLYLIEKKKDAQRRAAEEDLTSVETLQESCATVSEIQQHIAEKQVFRQVLSNADVEKVLTAPQAQGTIRQINFVGENKYLAVDLTNLGHGLTYSPCGWCPVSEHCTPDGMVSPARCKYLSDWLAGDW